MPPTSERHIQHDPCVYAIYVMCFHEANNPAKNHITTSSRYLEMEKTSGYQWRVSLLWRRVANSGRRFHRQKHTIAPHSRGHSNGRHEGSYP